MRQVQGHKVGRIDSYCSHKLVGKRHKQEIITLCDKWHGYGRVQPRFQVWAAGWMVI